MFVLGFGCVLRWLGVCFVSLCGLVVLRFVVGSLVTLFGVGLVWLVVVIIVLCFLCYYVMFGLFVGGLGVAG